MQAGIDYFGPQPPLTHEFHGGMLDSMMGDGLLKKGKTNDQDFVIIFAIPSSLPNNALILISKDMWL